MTKLLVCACVLAGAMATASAEPTGGDVFSNVTGSLEDCRHAAANATGAPWGSDQFARDCHAARAREPTDRFSTEVREQSAACWDLLERAISEMQAAKRDYAQRSPDAARHHKNANRLIDEADRCIQQVNDVYGAAWRRSRERGGDPDRGRDPGRAPARDDPQRNAPSNGQSNGQSNAPQVCAARVAQTVLDFDRGFMDDASFGLTRWVRDNLLPIEGQIVDDQAREIGGDAGLVAGIVLPLGAGKAKLTMSFAEYARTTSLTAQLARAVSARSADVWKLATSLRGNVIERTVAMLEYIPNGYEWVGLLKGGTFRVIDFINYARKEQVQLKTMFRTTPSSWQSGVSEMKRLIDKLADLDQLGKRQWRVWEGPSCRGTADGWTRVLDIRVPRGFESTLAELVDYGRQQGIEVRISAF